jgi:uncharacterized pyridoxamine 5'-phosphate oxidase family protein
MPEKLIHLLMEWHTVPVATIGPDGKPNVAGKSVMVMNPETIIWGELYFTQTYENLTRNPRASICVWKRNPPFTAYKVNGRVTILKMMRLQLSWTNASVPGMAGSSLQAGKNWLRSILPSRKSMTRRQIRSLPENGLPKRSVAHLFPLFADATIICNPRVHSGPSCSSAHGKKMNYSERSFTPEPECCNPCPCGRIPGCSCQFRKLFIPGKNSEFYFQELKKGDQGETDDTR